MTSVALDELEKAHRSMRVTIFNNTSRVMTRQKIILHQGMLRVQPPETIDSLSTAEFGSESNGMMTGTEAGVIYAVQGVQGFFEFGWNNPYFGKRGYKKVAPAGFDTECSAIDGTNCAVSFVVNETAAPRSEAEIKEEKQKVEAAIAEMERVVNGIQKMLAVYASKKDAKNSKVVEDEITAKQRDIDQARGRLHGLNAELDKKAKEDDPVVIQQELQKVKTKIEAAAKVLKGIEMMKDMYSSGSQKDPRQAQIVEQQVESKKREIESLKKFEHRLSDRLNKSAPAKDAAPPSQEPATPVADIPSEAAPADSTPVHARILFDVVPTSDTELDLKVGDIVTVLDKSGAEWWEGEFGGKRGYFPAVYAELILEKLEKSESAKAEYGHLYPKATAIADYSANADGELSLKAGEIITVYGWDDAYWWEGSKDGVVGFFPCQCVQWIAPEATATTSDNTASNYEDIGKGTSEQTQAQELAQESPEPTPQESAPQEINPQEPAHQEPAHQEPAHQEPAHQVPAQQEPAHQEPAHQEPAHQEPAHQEPAHQEHAHQEPVHREPARQESISHEPTHQELIPHESTPQEPTFTQETGPVPTSQEPTPPLSIPHKEEPQSEPQQLPEPVPHHEPQFELPPQETEQIVEPVISLEPQLQQPASQPPQHEAQKSHSLPTQQEVITPAILDQHASAPQSQSPQAVARSKSAATPTTTSTAKIPLSAAQQASALRKAQSPSTQSGLGAGIPKASAKPRALPTPTQPVAPQIFSTDAALVSFKEGLRQRTTDFANTLEHFTSTTIVQYLDTIAKLQTRVKELEALQEQTIKERDELKVANAKLVEERDTADANAAKFQDRRSFWVEQSRK